MTPFAEFHAEHINRPRLELVRMLYRLASSWERIAMVGAHPEARGKVARKLLDMAEGEG